MKIGFIGAGGIAANYLATLKSADDVEIVAICDIDGDQAAAVAEPFQARVYRDHREMLTHEQFDAVFITIPPYAHTNQVELAARNGCAIFVAKPVALDLEVAVRTAQVISQRGVINAVGYMWRYASIVDRAQELLRGRAIGLVIGEVLVPAPQASWWRRRELSGGQVVEQTTHLFDLARYFVGEAQTVSGWGSRRMIPDRVDFEDATVVNLKFADEVVGSITSSCAAPDGRFTLELVARDARLRLEFNRRLTGRIDDTVIDEVGAESGYERQIHAFLEAVRTKDQRLIRSSYRNAVATLALTLAAERSILTGRWEPAAQ